MGSREGGENKEFDPIFFQPLFGGLICFGEWAEDAAQGSDIDVDLMGRIPLGNRKRPGSRAASPAKIEVRGALPELGKLAI